MNASPQSRFQTGIQASPDHILAATGIDDADLLLPHIVAQAKAGRAAVTLVHAILPANLLDAELGQMISANQEIFDRRIESLVDAIADRIRAEGLVCRTVVKHGYAADVIQEQIHATGATRLILGTHGRKSFARMALGSVADELIGNIDIPILAVGPHARHLPNHAIPRKILHPVSLTGDYRHATDFAMQLAQAHHAELTLLYVLDPDAEQAQQPNPTLAWAQRSLSALAPNGRDLRPPVYTSVVCGNRLEQIRLAATRIDADWIVVGVDPSLPRWPLCSTTAYQLLIASPLPILTLRSRASRAPKPLQDEAVTLFESAGMAAL